jgi:hypothetical protein
MQAGHCGSQMGTTLREVVCDENDIGGDGEYIGDNYAQLGRINLSRSLGRQVRAPHGAFRPLARRDRRRTHVAARRAPPPGELRETGGGRGRQLGQKPLHKDSTRIPFNPPVV